MSGMTNIIEIINSKTAEKEKEILSEAEAQKKKKLDDARAKVKEITASITGKAEIESNAEVSRYEASAKLQSKYKLLEAKEVIIEDVLLSVRTHLEDHVKKKAYGKTLEKLIVDAAASLEETELEIVAPKGHSSNIDLKTVEAAVTKATGKKCKLSISKDEVRATGGVIVRNKDSTRWVDNTFEARLERYESQIRDTISSILFGSEEKKE
ncbi:MAG: V-type ATP synthase subunit E family protein [Candidatus Thorarchaeota archaeon]|jgi:V/A-type H+-transporting ATPase subunit E